MNLINIMPRLLAPTLVFALMVTAAHTSILPRKNVDAQSAPAQKADNCPVIITSGKKVSVILHGLMVGRYKEGNDKRFELGIVKRVPNHKFVFNVYINGVRRCFTAPGCDYSQHVKDGNKWIFEVTDNKGSAQNNIAMYNPGSSTSLREIKDIKSLEQAEDSRLILNIEEDLHKVKLKRYNRAFKPIFHFRDGEVRTHCPTVPITAQQVENEETGSQVHLNNIAEAVRVDFTLREGQQLVMKKENGRVGWVHTQDNKKPEVEGRLLNLDRKHIGDNCRAKYGCECPHSSRAASVPQPRDPRDSDPTDFQQYYYLVFDVDRPERFELMNPTGECHPLRLFNMQRQWRKMAPEPYRCGMVVVGKDSGEINTR